MDNQIPRPLPSAVLKVTSTRAQVSARVCGPNSRRGGIPRTAGLARSPASRPAPSVTPRVCSASVPPPPCPSVLSQARPAPPPQPHPVLVPPPRLRLSGPPRAAPVPPPPSGALRCSQGAARPLLAAPLVPELAPPSPAPPPPPPPFRRSPRLFPGIQPRLVSSPWRRGGSGSLLRTPRKLPAELAWGVCPFDGRRERTTSGFGLEFCIPEIPRNYLDKTDAIKAPKYRQNGRLLVLDPKEKVMIEPSETMSNKCLFERRPRLASKLYASPAQVSLNVAKTFSEKKEVCSKNIENKVSLKNTENRVSSKSIENKDIETNLQSKLWSSSFLKESKGGVGKDAVIAEQEKISEYCLQDIDDKLSESTDDDGEDDTNDEDNDEDSTSNKDTHAPLELMAEFLRAEMSQDYHLAKKLCQMKKTQTLEEDDEDSEEDSSGESEGESSEDLSEESSDECEDE
ncbi:glutamate-rich protein 2 isoform X3 [Equus caballus]|uniref:glutamate-rich protein 2 isoform X3 n=1 Tax=Equus caballus TaxID=9796 RepID=UPI0038B33E7F